ncbi:MAG: cytochrome c, partial [Lysobacter sp.]|nr:cytochrome c [Lysobacter sp.]
TKRLDPKQIKEKIQKGGGLMPPFGQLSPKDVEDIAAFLKQ